MVCAASEIMHRHFGSAERDVLNHSHPAMSSALLEQSSWVVPAALPAQ